MRFNDIQVLRFFAATSVVLLHANYYVSQSVWKTSLMRVFDLRFGWGVELFFAISGFVVSHSLSRTTPLRFFALRLLRIYPAFWMAAILVILGQWVVGERPAAKSLALALTLLPVGEAAVYPLGGVEWSLIYEVFFYALLGVLALLRGRGTLEWAMLAWLSVIGASALMSPGYATKFLPTISTIAFSAFNLPFIAGVLAYSWFRRVDRLPAVPLTLMVPLGLAAASKSAALEHQLAFLALGFGSLVLLAAELSRRWDARPGNVLVRLGDWSYGIYLVQVPVIKAVLALIPFAPDDANAAFLVAALAALVVGCGYGALEMSMYRRNKARLPNVSKKGPRRD